MKWSELCQRHQMLMTRVDQMPKKGISNDVYRAVYAKDIDCLPGIQELRGKELSRNYFQAPMDLLLQIETAHQDVEMRRYDLLKRDINLSRGSIDLPGLSNGQPTIVPGDIVLIYDEQFEIQSVLHVTGTRGDSVLFNPRKCAQFYDQGHRTRKLFNVAFISLGSQFEICRRALMKAEDDERILNIIWENDKDEYDVSEKERRAFMMDWTEKDFVEKFDSTEANSWIETLFKTEKAHYLTRKNYMINPLLSPDFRARKTVPDHKRDFFTIHHDKGEICDTDRVIVQDPKTLEAFVLPFKGKFPFVKIPEDKHQKILNFLCAPNLDFMFVAGTLIEASGQKDLGDLGVQPSLRDLFHYGREEMDSLLACNSFKIDPYRTETDELESRLNRLNGPQRQAVLAILEARYRPAPYIIFGPPGTGKTHTLVEAVVQIYKRHCRARILITANSNTCADQIHEKLTKTGLIDINDYERIRAGDQVRGQQFRRIIVTTNIKSGGLMSLDHPYDWVFVDEAGHAHIGESLVPICSLELRDGCLVLAGDPMQLGPVVQCHQVSQLGLGTSLLERIFTYKAYDKRIPYGRYNQYCITKLLHCYRCDPDILAISNKLFYDNELRYVSRTPPSLLRMMNLKKSVQFMHVNSQENQPVWSTSWRNYKEAHICVEILLRLYKMGLSASQIGIITPYKLQSKEINKSLKSMLQTNARFLDKRFPHKKPKRKPNNTLGVSDLTDIFENLNLDAQRAECANAAKNDEFEWEEVPNNWYCKCETVDSFQGDEREVIIISTVRTGTNRRLDFLNDSRRFNVAVSRAKFLVIVVGDRGILNCGSYWPEFLKQAEKDDLCKWPQQSFSHDPFYLSTSLFRR